MAENFDHFSMEQIAALASSPAGRQLLTMLRQSNPGAIQQAAAMASAGDVAGAKHLLAPILADPQIQALIGQLGGK